MNATGKDVDGEAHQREPTLGSYIYSIGIFFGVLAILIAIAYFYYYIIYRLKTTGTSNSRNNPPIRNHRRRRSRSPTSIATSDYDSEFEFTSNGLDESTINSFPVLLYSDVKSNKDGRCGDSGCCICLKDFKETDSIRLLLPECGHLFHVICVDAWLKIKTSCPVCRNSLLRTPVDNPPATEVAA